MGLSWLGMITCPLLRAVSSSVSIADGFGSRIALGDRGSGSTAIAFGGDVIIVGCMSSIADGWGAAGA